MLRALPEGPRGRLLAVLLTLTMLGILWSGCVAPLRAWHAERTDALRRRQILLEHMTTLVSALPKLQRQLSGEHAPAHALLGGGSDAIAGATLQGRVQQMAAVAGAELSSMELLPAEPRGAYRRISLRVATSAQWAVLVSLLRAVEEGVPQMLIDDLQLRALPVSMRRSNAPINAEFTVIAFRDASGSPAK